ncbi:MAG: zf-TFIIB domain-containing protein [Rhodobacteraceae bacterium]|jgi:Zn-finger nucleic acid-binding protein|nr:zf-TFIIB domain-containing protein [Paracoccaceae bacterium]
MQCPVDGETLVMTDRSGVEIDYCPKCRGVWLDRGELDKIIDRVAAAPAAMPERAPEPPRAASPAPVYQPEPARESYGRDDRRRHHDDDDDDRYRYGKRKRRESFLSELFDF